MRARPVRANQPRVGSSLDRTLVPPLFPNRVWLPATPTFDSHSPKLFAQPIVAPVPTCSTRWSAETVSPGKTPTCRAEREVINAHSVDLQLRFFELLFCDWSLEGWCRQLRDPGSEALICCVGGGRRYKQMTDAHHVTVPFSRKTPVGFVSIYRLGHAQLRSEEGSDLSGFQFVS